MTDPMKPNETPGLLCHRCGEPVAEVSSSDFDDAGPCRVEFACANGHRTIVQRVEILEDDDDPGPVA